MPEGIQITMRCEGVKKLRPGSIILIMPRIIIFRRREVGNYAVFQRPYRLDVVVCLFVHLHGRMTNRQHLARRLVDRDDRRLIHYYFVLADY